MSAMNISGIFALLLFRYSSCTLLTCPAPTTFRVEPTFRRSSSPIPSSSLTPSSCPSAFSMFPGTWISWPIFSVTVREESSSLSFSSFIKTPVPEHGETESATPLFSHRSGFCHTMSSVISIFLSRTIRSFMACLALFPLKSTSLTCSMMGRGTSYLAASPMAAFAE